MSELGIHCLALASDWKPEYAAKFSERLASHDMDMVELPLFNPAELDTKATRTELERHNLRAHFSLVLPGTLDVLNRTDEAADFLKMALSTADKSGGKIVTGVTYSKIGGMTPEKPQQRELDAICRMYDKVSKTAQSLGMRIGIEAINRYETKLINTAAQAREIIERVGSASLLIHLDTYHMNIEEKNCKKGFADAGEMLGYVHLSESNRGVPGQGTVDWIDVFEGLKEVGYTGPMALESFVYMVEELAGGLAIWRPVAENPDDVIDVGVPFMKEKAKESGYQI